LPLIAAELLVVLVLSLGSFDTARGVARDHALQVLHADAMVAAQDVLDGRAPAAPRTPWGEARLTMMEVRPTGSGQTAGVVVRDTGVDAPAVADMDDHLNRPEIAAALRSGSGSSVRQSATIGDRLLYSAIRVERGGQVPLVVRLAVPMSSVLAGVSFPFGLMVASGLVLALASLALLLVMDLRRKVETGLLAEAADSLGAGRPVSQILDERIGPDLQPVSRAIARMSEDVQQRIAALEVSESEMQGILQSMGNGVLALDPHQRILNLNRAAEGILGLTRATCRGDLLAEHVRDPSLASFIEDARQRGRHHAAELELQSLGGRHLDVVSEPLHDGSGQVIGLLLVFNDLTRVRQLERIRTDFASNVSHELRTPITAIQGYAEVLAEQLHEGDLSVYVDVIERNAARLSAIIEDLLSLSRLEQKDNDDLDRGMVDLSDLAEEVASMLRPLAEERSITLGVDAEDVPQVEGSRQLLEQAVVNLTTNAIRYSGEGASVWLAARRVEPGMVEVSVIDTGPGIAEEHIPRLFERFYRVDRGRSRQEGGTGLGLSIVKHIALVHGGRVEVESRLGGGSAFSIVLPATAGSEGMGGDVVAPDRAG